MRSIWIHICVAYLGDVSLGKTRSPSLVADCSSLWEMFLRLIKNTHTSVSNWRKRLSIRCRQPKDWAGRLKIGSGSSGRDGWSDCCRSWADGSGYSLVKCKDAVQPLLGQCRGGAGANLSGRGNRRAVICCWSLTLNASSNVGDKRTPDIPSPIR